MSDITWSFGGKVALVSGGASGIGRAAAAAWVAAGARVAVFDQSAERLEETAGALGREALATVAGDVSDEGDCERVVGETLSRYGRIDVLCNNAGVGLLKSVTETERDAYDRVLDTNVWGIFTCSRYAIPQMIAGGGGSIVNISSVAGIGQSLHQEPAYAASKGAIRIFTKVTASQHAKDRIRCNSVHPGPIDTEMLHSAIPDKDALQRRLQRVPLGRMGTVAEIVTAVLYLASDDSAYMTGSELVIDGGALAQ